MNKTIERLIPAGMIAVLATAFFQVAHATNESDYKYGFRMGEDAYKDCSRYNGCTTDENLLTFQCDHNQGIRFDGHHTTHIFGPDNATACNHGWIHECLKDNGGALCVYQPRHFLAASAAMASALAVAAVVLAVEVDSSAILLDFLSIRRSYKQSIR